MRGLKWLALWSTVVFVFTGSALGATTWQANSVWPPENHHSKALIEFAQKVEEKTGKELVLKVSTGGALGFKGPELLKVVRDGLVHVSDMLMSGVAGDEPIFGITTLPFLVKDFAEAKILNEVARPYYDKAAEKWNQKILYTVPWPAAGLFSKKPIKSIEDMKGLKTRTYDKNGALVIQALGATPHPLPFSEVYTALATGLIDSVLTSTPTAVDAKFWEVLKYFQRINITQGVDMVNVNLTAFNKLDRKLQEALVEVGREMEEKWWKEVERIDAEMEKKCNDNGIESVPPSEEFMKSLSEVARQIHQDWLASAPAEAKEVYHKFLEKVGRKQ